MTEDYHKNYYKTNKERMQQQHSAYYQAHREEILEKSRAKREADPDKAKQQWQEYYRKNKLRIKMRREMLKEQKENENV